MEEDLYTSTFWTKEQRDFGWTMISSSRSILKIPISPIFTRSFIYLHYYYSLPKRKAYDFYILLISSLFISCKVSDIYRPLQCIFQAFMKSCVAIQKYIGIDHQQELLGKRTYDVHQELTDNEITLIGQCEVDLLNAIQWKMRPINPLDFFNSNELNLLGDETEIDQGICEKIMHDVCVIIKNENYLKFHPEAIAAASVNHCFPHPIQGRLKIWIDDQQMKYKDEIGILFQIMVNEAIPFK